MTVAAETGAELTSLPIESKSLGETARLRRRAVAGPVGQRVRRHAICLQVMKRSVTRLPGGPCPGPVQLEERRKAAAWLSTDGAVAWAGGRFKSAELLP